MIYLKDATLDQIKKIDYGSIYYRDEAVVLEAVDGPDLEADYTLESVMQCYSDGYPLVVTKQLTYQQRKCFIEFLQDVQDGKEDKFVLGIRGIGEYTLHGIKSYVSSYYVTSDCYIIGSKCIQLPRIAKAWEQRYTKESSSFDLTSFRAKLFDIEHSLDQLPVADRMIALDYVTSALKSIEREDIL